MSLQAKLEAIRQAVEAKTIPCPCVEGPACYPACSCHKAHISGGCQICTHINYREGILLPGHTAHRIPDPAYAPLLDIVRFPCSESGSTICGVEMGLSCERCRNTGYLTRNWDGLPPGALAGVLSLAIWKSPLKIHIDVVDLLNERDPDEAACDAVLLALQVGEKQR